MNNLFLTEKLLAECSQEVFLFVFLKATKEVDFVFDVDGVADDRDIADFVVGGAVGAAANVLNGAVN